MDGLPESRTGEAKRGESMTHDLQGKCNKCGMCCRAIILIIPPERTAEYLQGMIRNNPEYVQRIANGDVDFKAEKCDDGMNEISWIFVGLNWVNITQEEAITINPFLEKWGDIKGHFYKCKQFDESLNSCRIHDNKPNVCAEYPWYKKSPTESTNFYSEQCGYKIDIELMNLEGEEK